MLKRLLAALLIATPLFTAMAQADAKFESFIQSLWPRVKAAGISRSLFDAAFAGVTDPDPAVLKLAATQPEFTSTTSAYLAKAVTPIRIDTGQQMKGGDAGLLSAIEKKYGVDRHILLGIWGMESNFGKDKGLHGRHALPGNTHLCGAEKTICARTAHRRLQDIEERQQAAREILPAPGPPPWATRNLSPPPICPMRWIGPAMARRISGDPRKMRWPQPQIIWTRPAGNPIRPWGWEVSLPAKFNKALIGRSKWRPVSEWVKLGVTPAGGGKFSAPQADAFVMIPQGIDGPAFLVTRNFLALMAYNFSHSYALAVGHLADRIRGGGPIVGTWPDLNFDLSFAQRVDLQKRLSRLGFETGGADGRFGARTYEAIIAYQKSVGLPLDGKPSAKLLERLQSAG